MKKWPLEFDFVTSALITNYYLPILVTHNGFLFLKTYCSTQVKFFCGSAFGIVGNRVLFSLDLSNIQDQKHSVKLLFIHTAQGNMGINELFFINVSFQIYDVFSRGRGIVKYLWAGYKRVQSPLQQCMFIKCYLPFFFLYTSLWHFSNLMFIVVYE